MRALVFLADPRRPWLANRSVRSLKVAGFDEILTSGEINDDAPCLILRAGVVLHDPANYRPPPATGCLMGVGLSTCWDEDAEWSRFQSLHGGHFPTENLPPPVCEWHSSGRNAMARLLGKPFAEIPLVVHWPRLDHAPYDPRLFVMQVVTSIQHGGAERIACDLAENLPRHGVRSRLVTLGKPHRTPLPAPPDLPDLSHLSRHERPGFLADAAIAAGADVLHLHLTHATLTRAIAASGIPVIATVHNSREGWPLDWETLQSGDVRLLLACSQAAENELRDTLPHIPVRTVWNGIDPYQFPETRRSSPAKEFTLACVANPRPQKRLERLPEILSATRAELAARGVIDPVVRLVIAGEVCEFLADAVACRAAVDREARKLGVTGSIAWTEGKTPVREVLENARANYSNSSFHKYISSSTSCSFLG